VAPIQQLTTPRLLLRRWQREDESAMAGINRDPEVIELLNRPADEEAVQGFFGAMVAHWDQYGYGPWAVESRDGPTAGQFVGFVGFAQLPPQLSAAGTGPELGWRLKRDAWGHGYATEAAAAALHHGIRMLGAGEVISVIHPQNVRSQRVAEKLGMTKRRCIDNPMIGVSVEVWSLLVH
jgi:RimJ/RimL family protein N-acetyltransferase